MVESLTCSARILAETHQSQVRGTCRLQLRLHRRRRAAYSPGESRAASKWGCVAGLVLAALTTIHSSFNLFVPECNVSESTGRRQAMSSVAALTSASFRSLAARAEEDSTPAAPEARIASVIVGGVPTGGTQPAWVDEFELAPVGFLGGGVLPNVRWRPLPASGGDPFGDRLVYPQWLSGTWNVKYKQITVVFPQGPFGGGLRPDTPGVALGSVLLLPNVDADPTLQWRFNALEGNKDGVVMDWAFTLPNLLEAFWNRANITEVPSRRPGTGWAVSYVSPLKGSTTGMRPEGIIQERTVTLTWLATAVWQEEPDGTCLSVEWIRQVDELTGIIADYKVLITLKPGDDRTTAIGRYRIAGFPAPIEGIGGFKQTADEAVALYDYSIELSRAKETDPRYQGRIAGMKRDWKLRALARIAQGPPLDISPMNPQGPQGPGELKYAK